MLFWSPGTNSCCFGQTPETNLCCSVCCGCRHGHTLSLTRSTADTPQVSYRKLRVTGQLEGVRETTNKLQVHSQSCVALVSVAKYAGFHGFLKSGATYYTKCNIKCIIKCNTIFCVAFVSIGCCMLDCTLYGKFC